MGKGPKSICKTAKETLPQFSGNDPKHKEKAQEHQNHFRFIDDKDALHRIMILKESMSSHFRGFYILLKAGNVDSTEASPIPKGKWRVKINI